MDLDHTTLSKKGVSRQPQAVSPGDFDRLTIMRYAPFYRERANGGVEQCLRRLNRGLLERHRLHILQVYRVSNLRSSKVEVETSGNGRITWIPIACRRTAARFGDIPTRARFVFSQSLHLSRQTGRSRPRALLNAIGGVFRNKMSHLRHRNVILSDPLSPLLSQFKVDLLAVHGLTYDAGSLIDEAKRIGIPFVLVNHFDNGHYAEPHVERWLGDAAGVGAVSGKGLPDHVQGRCTNLSDAIDTEFFAPENAQSLHAPGRPIVLLPALIKPGKGQMDLLRAASILKAKENSFQICFAGHVESESLYEDLRRYVAAAGLKEHVVFLGELTQEEVRNYYALATVVVLPTYSEGLGRCLLEAEAMEAPVVAYETGGVGETILQGETGYLVKTGDFEALAERIGFLLSNESERLVMGKRGREFVLQRFSVLGLVQRHEVFYQTALSRGKDPSAAQASGDLLRVEKAYRHL